MNINQSISFLVFMLSIRLGGCDTNLVEAKDYILNNGGYVSNSVTKKTDALIVGENPGSKLQKAKDLGIMVINEEKFYEKMKI